MWNPQTYLAFADQRGRPFFDLMSRVGAESPRGVADLGCGPGNLTEHLVRRWPDAVVEAWDSSAEMVAAARERGIDAHVGDVRDWVPKPDTDVVLSNAMLQWIPEHVDLLVRWVDQLAPGATEACVVFTVDNHLGTFAVPLSHLNAATEADAWVEAIPVARNDRPAWVGLGGEATV